MPILIFGDHAIALRAADGRASAWAAELTAHLGAQGPGNAGAGLTLEIRSCDALPPSPPDATPLAAFPEDGVSIASSHGALVVLADGLVARFTPAGDAAVAFVRGEPGAARVATLASLLLCLCLLVRQRGLVPLHAGALAAGRRGVLVAAASGAGKTTLVLNLVRSGWAFVSDDALLLARGREGVTAVAFRRTFGVLPETLAAFPELAGPWPAMASDSRKARVDVARRLPDQFAPACAPTLILFPTLTDAPASTIEPMRPAGALMRLAAQSALLHIRPDWTREHFALLQALVEQARCAELRAGHDLLDDPDAAARLIDAYAPDTAAHAA
jgi:hypothetical protein